MINYARFIDVNPENALEKTNKKIHQSFSIFRKNCQKRRKKYFGDDVR
jgi:uncharacterized protein YabN with tetrapyrrole methylase and pyrophosphatase domain